MNQNKDFLPQLFTPVAILLGSLIISWAIMHGPGIGTTSLTPAAAAPTVQKSSKEVNMKNQPSIGKADAPIVIAYWYDYQCPFCQKIEENVMAGLMKDYVNTGKVKLVFKDLQFLGDDSQTIGRLARAVWEVAPTQFYAWHKAIFDNQGQENSGWATREKLSSITTSALGATLANKIIALADANKDAYQKLIDADKAEGQAFGAKSTPTMVIGKSLIVGAQSYENIKAAIDSALAGK
jgi:protein-disulfide isomerase